MNIKPAFYMLLMIVASSLNPMWALETIQLPVHLPTSIAVAPEGLYIGENQGWVPGVANHIFYSGDFGDNWEFQGLVNRGITDLYYHDSTNMLLATTYYLTNGINGLFISQDKGETWEHKGLNFSARAVSRDSRTIYLGGYSHGLWVSHDEGDSWEQRIGTGHFGPNIERIYSTEELTLVAAEGKIYRTSDQGHNLHEITTLKDKSIRHFAGDKGVYFAGSENIYGLYNSKDSGNTWQEVPNFKNKRVRGLVSFQNYIFVCASTPSGEYSVSYAQLDDLLTWRDLEVRLPTWAPPTDMGILFEETPVLIITNYENKLYKLPIPSNQLEQRFLSLPWQAADGETMLENVTALFDHQYPLLGYSPQPEPQNVADTTTDFWGNTRRKPALYYSSHNGVDFALPYGTEVVAPADGIAEYAYCTDCGHTIKINHQNGYQSIFMHLQKDNLIVQTPEISLEVKKGQAIGLVGMTGKTTGPHLHYTILKDKNKDGSFVNDYPSGYTDPFGWQTWQFADPWPLFSWTDYRGSHSGTNSTYLWEQDLPSSNVNTSDDTVVTHTNKEVMVEVPEREHTTVRVQDFIRPTLLATQNTLKYIANSSVKIEMIDQKGNFVKTLTNPLRIKIDLSSSDLTNILIDTIGIYFLNELSGEWEPLPSLYTPADNSISTVTSHLSWFAVLAHKDSNQTPESLLTPLGATDELGWYETFPSIYIANNNDGHMYYSLVDNFSYQRYKGEFILRETGVVPIYYKSVDNYGNWEEEKAHILKINTHSKPVYKVRVRESSFTT